MKTTKLTPIAAATLLLTLDWGFSTCLGQGSLTPPGAPTPTMKSLDQVEARTPISAAPFTIIHAGSYYLTTNITANAIDTNAISIMADNVTLDLNGFTISSTANPAAGFAICLNSSHANITIVNGLISSGVTIVGGVFSGPGFVWGVAHLGSPARNVRVSNLTVTGCQLGGIYIYVNNTVIQSCVADTAGDTGLFASSVLDSTAVNCGGNGIYANYAYNSAGTAIGSGDGIYANNAYNCNGNTSTGTGLYAVNVAANCSGGATSGFGGASAVGVHANTANNCLGYIPGGVAAIQATIANGCYGLSSSTGAGVSVSYLAVNCYGYSLGGKGVSSGALAENCYGYTDSGNANDRGLKTTWAALNCFGQNDGAGFGLETGRIAIGCLGISATTIGISSGAIANSCWSIYGGSTAMNAPYRYNQPQ